MNIETQRINIVSNIYIYSTDGKPLTAIEYKNHLDDIIKLSDAGEVGYTTEEARKKIVNLDVFSTHQNPKNFKL